MVTILGKSGEYGGPSTVAQELATITNRDAGGSFDAKILAGSLESSVESNSKLSIIPVSKPSILNSRFFLFSYQYFREAYLQVKNADLIHLHFSRELIQIYSGFLCIILKKNFITQTHGMIRPKKSLWFFDLIFTRPILRKARANLVLTKQEERALCKVENSLQPKILSNGTFFSDEYLLKEHFTERDVSKKFSIVFCARLHHTKGIQTMIEVCRLLKRQSIVIDFYGPDYGELSKLKSALMELKDSEAEFVYKGTVHHHEIRNLLRQYDLMILPSEYDPFPMIVLESLSVGTPVLISKNCGQSSIVKNLISNSVCNSNLPEEYKKLILEFQNAPFTNDERIKLLMESKKEFSIETIWKKLSVIYESLA